MNEQKPALPEESNELDSLEEPNTVVEDTTAPATDSGAAPTPAPAADGDVISAENPHPTPVGPPPKPPLGKRLVGSLLSFNIYLLLFIFVLIVGIVIVVFAYNYSNRKSGTTTLSAQGLSQSTLNQLADSDATVGGSNQVLNVQSSAVFAGKILARSDVEVAGNLVLGGNLNLPELNVSDSATFGQAQVSRNLSVTGNTAVQGGVTIQQSLQVGGGGTFNGPLSATQITVSSLQLNGDLDLTHHITAGGATPARSDGPALGSGGTASVGGSDTSGSVSINTGSGTSAGCFITVTFASKFNNTPHVIITPVGSDAAGIPYYINRSTTSFSICTTAAPPASASFGFDYFVLD